MPVDGSAVGTLCFVSINPSFLPSFLHETLRMIDHLCGTGRAENKERYRKYFEKCDKNCDGVLEHAEVHCALNMIYSHLSMDPPSTEKLETLFTRCDKNGEWTE